MAIISGSYQCPGCGRTWKLPVNTSAPDYAEQQEDMRRGQRTIEAICETCRDYRKRRK